MTAAKRHPPAFQIEIGPQPLLQGLLALLTCGAAVVLVAGLAEHLPRCWWLLPGAPAVGWFGWRLARIEPRHLQWDGQVWRLAPADLLEPGPVVDVEVLMDFGAWLLLRACSPTGWLPRRCYLPLARAGVGSAWGQLRATLYSARPQRDALG